MPRMTIILPLLLGCLLLSACAESIHQVQRDTGYLGVPAELAKQIDTSVTFADLQTAPDKYVGRVVMVGGIVILAKRTTKETEIEILELPTKSDGPSTKDRLRSKGRFFAVREEFLDPASVPAGTPITIVGVVRGSTTRRLDDSDYTYPVLDIKHLVDWTTVASQSSGGLASGFYGAHFAPYGYWGRPYGYWGRPYGYTPYWGTPHHYFGHPRLSAPTAPRPAPRNAPPLFRRR